MTHFELDPDTFNRMEMLASDDSFHILLDMESIFENLNLYEIENKMLKNKDSRAFQIINLTLLNAMTKWIDETYSEKDLEKKEVREYITEIQIEIMRLITVFLNIEFQVIDDESFRLRYREN